MNVINFFQEVANIWNSENKCGFCWSFGAPLSESSMNETRLTDSDKCCVQMFITEYETDSSYQLSPLNIPSVKYCDHIFSLYIVQPSNLGINTFNEIKGHDISESIWKTILEPIQNCIGCGNEFDLCELGYDFNILRWKMSVVKFKEDQNYTGWRIMGIFRETINL